ncbi:hypothetical protein M3Y97_00191600 [Aphelenchoides bicaudatus]|nr:hypothetical protein M3Y97_00191600 [Aphelenchoides bicaudatus]
MNILKELSSSQHSIDMDFVPNSEMWIKFLPRKPPDVEVVIKGAASIYSTKEDLESDYYRTFNWVHVETCNRHVSFCCTFILFIALLIDLFVVGPTFEAILLFMHMATFGLVHLGSQIKNPYLYYPHIALSGFAAICYALFAFILISASLVINGSEITKTRVDLQVDQTVYMWNGILLAILAGALYYTVNVCFRDLEYLSRILLNRSEFQPWQY